MGIETHEHEARQLALVETAERFLEPGDFVIRRAAFRWMRRTRPGEGADYTRPPDGWSVISNAYECYSADYVCAEVRRDWDLVHDFNHFAIVRGASHDVQDAAQ